MTQKINKELNLEVDIFNCSEDEFIYFYLGLSYEVKKRLSNAFYKGYYKRIIKNKRPFVIHKQDVGYTTLEIHPLDVFMNRDYIKDILRQEQE